MNPNLLILVVFLGGTLMMIRSQLQSQGSALEAVTTEDGEGDTLGGLLSQAAGLVQFGGASGALSLSGLELLKRREGFSATAYPDHKGYSIGYGHLIRPGDGLDRDSRVSQDQALQLLAEDVAWAVAAVNRAINAPLSQGQFDALVSFAYNVGAGAFAGSTLVKRINAGDAQASAEFSRWVYASGQRNAALVARRDSESEQFESDAA